MSDVETNPAFDGGAGGEAAPWGGSRALLAATALLSEEDLQTPGGAVDGENGGCNVGRGSP